MSDFKIIVEKVIREKIKFRKKENVSFLKEYYNTKLEVLGLSLPVQRQIAKDGFIFSKQPLELQLKIWDDIFHETELHEAKFQALFFIEGALSKIEHQLIWKTVKSWPKGIDNWAHSDLLSSVYSRMLERNEKMIYPKLEKWNTSNLPWARRQSIVSLLYYRRNRKVFLPFEKMIFLVENLLDDKDYYVQKGVGWTLRELWQIDNKLTEEFIIKNLNKISSFAYTAAVEKVSFEKRIEWKLKRKNFRNKK